MMSPFLFFLSFLALVTYTRAQNDEWFKIKSEFDGRVITTTETVASGGVYTIYHTVAKDDTGNGTQKWKKAFGSQATSVDLQSQAGPLSNTVSTYKPCEDCFATSESWAVSGSKNEKTTLRSKRTDTCLANPGSGGFLLKKKCDASDKHQIWRFILAK